MFGHKFFKGLLLSVLVLLTACGSSNNDWNSNFIVWQGDMYEAGDVFVQDVGEELGKVTVYSDREGSYWGTFSNQFPKGTKFFAIPVESSGKAIAIEEGDAYRKAVNTGKYGGK